MAHQWGHEEAHCREPSKGKACVAPSSVETIGIQNTMLSKRKGVYRRMGLFKDADMTVAGSRRAMRGEADTIDGEDPVGDPAYTVVAHVRPRFYNLYLCSALGIQVFRGGSKPGGHSGCSMPDCKGSLSMGVSFLDDVFFDFK
jgi:hypothetical protein